MVDNVTTCGYYWVKFWANSDVKTLVRVYRVPFGTPALPFPHRFLNPSFDGRRYPKRYPAGLRGLDFILEPGEPGLPVGFFFDKVRYDRGSLPAGYVPPTGWVGSLRQWQEGSILGVDPPLTFNGPFSAGCRPPASPNAQACAVGCDQIPLTSGIWQMEGFTPFAGFTPTALVKREGCVWSSACVPGGPQCPDGTAAAWQVVPSADQGGVVGGVVAYKRANVWSSCCERTV